MIYEAKNPEEQEKMDHQLGFKVRTYRDPNGEWQVVEETDIEVIHRFIDEEL